VTNCRPKSVDGAAIVLAAVSPVTFSSRLKLRFPDATQSVWPSKATRSAGRSLGSGRLTRTYVLVRWSNRSESESRLYCSLSTSIRLLSARSMTEYKSCCLSRESATPNHQGFPRGASVLVLPLL